MFTKTFEIKLSTGKVVKAQTYTLRDKAKILVSKMNETGDTMKKLYMDLVDAVEPNLPKHDAELVLVRLIGESENENKLVRPYTCTCGKVHNKAINLEHLYVSNIDQELIYSFPKFKVEFEWPKLWDDDDITMMIVKSIKYIYAGDERLTLDDLTDNEVQDLYNAITEDTINYIKNLLLAPKLTVHVPINCECGKNEVHTISGFKEFMEIV